MNNKLIFTGITLTDANLFGGVTFNQEVNAENDLMFGVVSSSSIKFTIDNSGNDAEKYLNQELEWHCKMIYDADYNYKGNYIVSEIKKNRKRATITAYSKTSKLDKIVDDYLLGVVWPISLNDFAIGLAQYCGLTLRPLTSQQNANYMIYNNFMGKNVTGKKIMSFVAQVASSFCVDDLSKEYDIKLGKYEAKDISIDNSKYISLSASEYKIDPIDKVQIQSTFDDIGYIEGTGENAYILTENALLFTSEAQETIRNIAKAMLAELSQITYTPMKFNTFTDFGIMCGDIITVNGMTCYVMKKTIKSSGCEFECVGNKRRETQNEDENSAIVALNNKTNELIMTVDETRSTLTTVQGKIDVVEDELTGQKTQIATLTTNVSEIKQTSDEITSTVSEVETTLNNLDGEVTVLSESYSTLSQTVDGFDARIVAAEGDAENAITKATEIEATVDGLSISTSTSSSGNETTTKFDLKSGSAVLSTTSVRGTTANQAATIAASAVNGITLSSKVDGASATLTLKNGSTTITSDTINFTGFVTFSDLSTSGKTTISGDNITTGKISADRIDVSTIKVTTVYNYAGTNIALKSDSSTLWLGGDGTWNFTNVYLSAGSAVRIGSYNNLTSNGLCIDTINLVLRPNSFAGWDLGDATHAFGDLYVSKINLRDSINTYGTIGNSNGTFEIVSTSGAVCRVGSSTYPFDYVYCDHLYIGGEEIGQGADIDTLKSGIYEVTLNSSTLAPSINGSISLGSSSYYFKYGYFNRIYLTSSCYISGSGSNFQINGKTLDTGGGDVAQLKSGRYIVKLNSNTLQPNGSNSYNLGSSSYYWNYIYCNRIYLRYGSYNSMYLSANSSGKLCVNGSAIH